MDKIERIINLKKEEDFIEEYVSLRNRYRELLLTKPVNVLGTKEWLKRSDIEVRGIVKGPILLGVTILYLNQNGEIAFFAKVQNQGLGTKLLKIIEEVAKEKKFECVWSWVRDDNSAAQKTFQKNGYNIERESLRFYENESRKGSIFRKEII